MLSIIIDGNYRGKATVVVTVALPGYCRVRVIIM